MGTVKVTNIEPIADNGTVTLGGSGDTFALASGVKQQLLRPSFSAYKSSISSISQNTWTKITFDTEDYDTDSAYDTSNGRFTVPTGKGGKYFFSFGATMQTQFAYLESRLYKNGSAYFRGNSVQNDASTMVTPFILDLDASDYIEAYIKQSVATQNLAGRVDPKHTYFNGFRIGD